MKCKAVNWGKANIIGALLYIVFIVILVLTLLV